MSDINLTETAGDRHGDCCFQKILLCYALLPRGSYFRSVVTTH